MQYSSFLTCNFLQKVLEKNIIGYRVVHEVGAEISDIYMVGSIIDDAVKAGANTVSDIKFSISEPQKYYKIALNDALMDASAKALSIGCSMGLYVNSIPTSIVEQTSPGIAPLQYMLIQPTTTTTPLQPGGLEMTAIVEAEFTYVCNGRH